MFKMKYSIRHSHFIAFNPKFLIHAKSEIACNKLMYKNILNEQRKLFVKY